MAKIALGGNPVSTNGELPALGSVAPNFTLTATDLNSKSLSDYGNVRKILNIFPSIGTGVCSASVRKFNEEASKLENTKVICISKDLPFAQTQFCAAEGIENVEMLSDFKNDSFSNDYGLLIQNGIFEGLHARVVIILDENNRLVYSELVPEISHEPNYKAAIKVLK